VKNIDPIKKAKYKSARKQGNSIVQSLKDAGYSNSVAHKSSDNTVVKVCDQEIVNELRAKDITVDWVVQQLSNELLAPDCRASDRIRVKELLGKYINMFKDNSLQVYNPVFNLVLDDLPPLPVTITNNGYLPIKEQPNTST